MQYIIEKNIDIPTARDASRKYPFNEMEVGDSYAVPASDGRNLRATASQYAKRHGIKLTCRKMGDQVRVWRVE